MFSALWMTNWKIDFYIWSNTSLIVSSCKYHAAACPPQFHTGEKLCELCYFTEIETLQHKVSLWLHRPAVVLMPNPSLVLQEVVWLTCHLKKHLLRETPTAPPEEREGTDVYTTPGKSPSHNTEAVNLQVYWSPISRQLAFHSFIHLISPNGAWHWRPVGGGIRQARTDGKPCLPTRGAPP